MNIRKYWKRILFSATTLFWASCGGDSENSPIIPYNNGSEPSSSSSVEAQTSSSAENPASSSTDIPLSSSETVSSSSTEVFSSSSIEIIPSSSSVEKLGPYKLARDTSITCKLEKSHSGLCVADMNGHHKIYQLINRLEQNDSRSLKELEEIGGNLLIETHCVSYEHIDLFKCSNDSTYEKKYFDPGKKDYYEIDSLLYSFEEYKTKFSSPAPSPLCQKTDFVYGTDSDVFDDTQAYIDSVKKEKLLSSDEQACINTAQHHNSAFIGILAKTQICDGISTTNPYYQAFIKNPIDECMKEE